MVASNINFEEIEQNAHRKRKVLDTLEINLSRAYDAGVRSAATDENGHIDYDLLGNEENGQGFANAWARVIQPEAERAVNSSGADDLWAGRLQRMYAGTNQDEILAQLKAKGKAFTKGTYNQDVPGFLGAVEGDLTQSVYGGIGREQVPEALSKANAEFLDPKTVPIEVVVSLLSGLFEGGRHYTRDAFEGKPYLLPTTSN